MPAPDGRRGGRRLRLLAGASLVAGAVSLLLSADRRRRRGADPAGEGDGTAIVRGEAPSAAAVRAGFEPRDADPRAIARAMVIGVAAIAASIAGLFVLLGLFHREDRARPALTSEQRAAIAPPGPPLQANPQFEIAGNDRREVVRLSTYRWLTPEHKAARIPIDRAMALVAGKPFDGTPVSTPAGP